MPPPIAPPVRRTRTAIVTVTMGYGHLRAAHALAEASGESILLADRPPWAGEWEVRHWDRLRRFYESLSRATEVPWAGRAVRSVLDGITAIPRPAPAGRMAEPSLAARHLASLVEMGFGSALTQHVRDTRRPLLSTFYAPAIVADAAGHEAVVSVVTDADVNRVWAPADAAAGRLRYAAPTARAARRLRAFGVEASRIHRTGFPIPLRLVGGRDFDVARRRLAARLVRLDPAGAFASEAPVEARRLRAEAAPEDVTGPLRVVFAIGGAGAQLGVARDLVHALREPLARGQVRLHLVAGTREETAEALRGDAAKAGFTPAPDGPVEVLLASEFVAYADRFHDALGLADLLWTKPSELTFFAATGLPIAFAPHIGKQEQANRAWAVSRGAATDGNARDAARWLRAALDTGGLARLAWQGFSRLPKDGTRKILELAASFSPG